MKPFTIISALLFFVLAAAHAYRAYAGLPIVVDNFDVPIVASWVCAGVTFILGVMLLVERK